MTERIRRYLYLRWSRCDICNATGSLNCTLTGGSCVWCA